MNVPLREARISRRYKRFLADVILPDGETRTVHCPNSGSMKTCWEPGWPCIISDSLNPARKLRYTLEMTHNGRCWIGINTHRANTLAVEAIRLNRIPVLAGFDVLRREVGYGQNSRIDILLEKAGAPSVYVEVKNVTLAEKGVYKFPDAVTRRGLKHLRELSRMVEQGHRAVMLYIVQRSDGVYFTTADEIDPAYGAGVRAARDAGVEVLCYRAEVSPRRLVVVETIEVRL
ncbi:MAG: DNA/RNA nuclease SfsA [Calditrichaeota bacterium]|nr:MAG: DNA/RNA nuclease SfsA [Calditrichota bacterium]